MSDSEQEREDTAVDEILLYESEDGQVVLEVQLEKESVWLTQAQMSTLFQRNKRTISEHIRNIFKERELEEEAVVRKSRITAADDKVYRTALYNLDVIISVGYRVKSVRGTRFRIWATSVLRDHLVRGYTVNRKRLEEKGSNELLRIITLLNDTLTKQNLVSDQGRAILDIINQYTKTWRMLLQYDEASLPKPEAQQGTACSVMTENDIRNAINTLKNELIAKKEASDLFGQERGGHGLSGILGALQQSFAGQELYPSTEEKAAHLLYFIIKDHPFTDGNKRIGSFLFILFLQRNGYVAEKSFGDRALIALALLTAASDADQKDLIIRLIMNLIP